MSQRLQKYLDYIANTGGSPKIEQFDDDWEPIGPMVRANLMKAGLTLEMDGFIYDAAKFNSTVEK